MAATTKPSPHRIIAFPLRKHFRADRFHDFRVSLADELFRTPQQNRDRAARLVRVRGLPRLSSSVVHPVAWTVSRSRPAQAARRYRHVQGHHHVAVRREMLWLKELSSSPLFVALFCLPTAPPRFPAWSSPRPAPVAKPRLRRMVIEGSIHRRTYRSLVWGAVDRHSKHGGCFSVGRAGDSFSAPPRFFTAAGHCCRPVSKVLRPTSEYDSPAARALPSVTSSFTSLCTLSQRYRACALIWLTF